MYNDTRGHQISSDNQAAAALCSDAVESFVRRHTDAVPLLQQSLSLDSDNTFAQATFGLMLHGARKASLQTDKLNALRAATATASRATPREQHYVSALQHASDGNLFAMIKSFETILQQDPTDLLALSLAQGELFWMGEMQRSLQLSEAVEPYWQSTIEGYPEYLSVLAFDLEEAGRYRQAEDTGRLSVDLRSTNAWGTHAVAHVLYMQGRHSDGVDWLS
ncbi:MAG: hypothetical protein AAF404_23080, partial [Pseudomonadota bacterium]